MTFCSKYTIYFDYNYCFLQPSYYRAPVFLSCELLDPHLAYTTGLHSLQPKASVTPPSSMDSSCELIVNTCYEHLVWLLYGTFCDTVPDEGLPSASL